MPNDSPQLIAVKELADHALAFKRPGPHSFVHFTPSGAVADPRRVMERLRTGPLADLLLPAGADMSLPNGGEYFPPLAVRAADELLIEVGLTVSGWEFGTYGNHEASSWGRELELSLWYGSRPGEVAVKQMLTQQAFDLRGDPTLSRGVFALDYAETGYEGHNFEYRTPTPAESSWFTWLFAELLATTPELRGEAAA